MIEWNDYFYQKKTVDIQLLKDAKDGSRLFALILMILGVGLFASLLGILASAFFIEGDLFSRLESMASMSKDSDIHLMKYYQMVTQLAFFILPALLFAFLMQKKIFTFFKLDHKPTLIMLGLGLMVLLLSNPFSEWLIYQNSKISLPESMASLEQWMRDSEEKAAFATNIFLDMKDWKDYVVNILMIGVFAALGEELLLRGSFQPLFIRMAKNAHIGIWITAFIFSFIHFQFYGFFARLFLGALLGYFFYYSKNLWIPIIAHFINNSLAVTYVFITKDPLYDTETLQMTGDESNSLYAILSISLVILGVYVFRYYGKKHRLNAIE